jgi:hypothetical protein
MRFGAPYGKIPAYGNAALQHGFAFDLPWSAWHYSPRPPSRTGETDMPLQNHLSELERKHQALEREIQDALSHPSTNDLKLAELKRRKLQLKDEIAKLKSTSPVVH